MQQKKDQTCRPLKIISVIQLYLFYKINKKNSKIQIKSNVWKSSPFKCLSYWKIGVENVCHLFLITQEISKKVTYGNVWIIFYIFLWFREHKFSNTYFALNISEGEQKNNKCKNESKHYGASFFMTRIFMFSRFFFFFIFKQKSIWHFSHDFLPCSLLE